MPRRVKRNALLTIFQPKHVYLPGTQILRQVDVDELADRLQIEERGKQDGAQGIPAADGKSLSVTEREIVVEIRGIWDETVQGAKRAYDGIRGRYASYTAETDIDSVLAEPANIAVKLADIARDDRDRVSDAYENVKDARRELERFKTRENIERPPRPPRNHTVDFAILAVFALIELGVNTSMFAGGEAQGVAGALTKVLAIPVLNIGGCAALTFLLVRQLLLRSTARKLLGVLGVLTTITWLIGLNLFVAHWRDSSEAAMAPDAVQSALQGALQHPLVLKSFMSWVLLFLGLLAGAAAIVEGWQWTDPIPGYGQKAQHLREADDAWSNLRDAVVGRLHELADASIEELKQVHRRADIAIRERPALNGEVSSLNEDLRLYADHLQAVLDILTARYREENLRARTERSVPQWETSLRLEVVVPKLPPLAPAPSRAVAGKLAKAIDTITVALKAAVAEIPTANELAKAGKP